MSEREPIRRVDWDAEKAAKEHAAFHNAKATEGKDYSTLRLTLRDLKFLYDIGVSCE